MAFDRTDFFPPHEGDNILPLSPFFSKLLRYAHRKSQRIAIRDVNLGIEKTYIEFLSDVLSVRNALRTSLSASDQAALRDGKDVYIALIAAGGYEYAVGFVAICALGAAVVPITILLPVEEAKYFVLKAQCAAILHSSSGRKLAGPLSTHLARTESKNVGCIEIGQHFRSSPMSPEDIVLSSDRYLDDNSAGVVIFTSGTTGPPKGAVMRKAFLHDTSAAVADHFGIAETDVILHVLPVHHATGIGINFLPYIYSGACIEFRSGSFDVVWLWERWKKGGLNMFSGVPTIYMRMMRHFEQKIAPLPQHEVDQYIAGARQFRALLCGTSALPTPVQDFWTKILDGKTILSRYGASEIGPAFTPSVETGPVPPGSVGPLFPGSTVKLSEGDEGEVLIKGPYMFSKYLFDETATANAHDADGFYKTGDLARREGKNYYILGRASLDILKSGGYKISALDIEREILGLPYVSEVMVVGVADEEYGQRVAAAVSLRDDQVRYACDGNGRVGASFTLEDLRRDLRDKLAGYKMPTLLRVIEGELPKSGTGKVVKKVLGPKFFPDNYTRCPEVQVWSKQRTAKL
ncbi:putative NRPS-like protein biosynthetic cluster [Emmonsiellopsis sp. PD_5]|nr:putative NRPS-like protein biosynthetic cluster [Emmonsiellopsis sp. PD_5]